ncbi:hypothetical protein L1987_35355 [Smallanthus sonchifolius]|uniref:Uncharacterized protein n=1 Tax=Smallanthus sonchifolius TaxID=185202 RepID=A0ACB9HVN3_9ASTR|nr:hypothetical protein L1987_35355 [Smallanthus sonchifolius]
MSIISYGPYAFEEYDTHDPKGYHSAELPFLKKRSKVIEIVAAHDTIFALAQSGVCAAFSRETNKRICFLNISPDEVIRSLFYNKNNDSLITVSVYIKRGQPDAGFPLFYSESLKWPGFVEFDDVNGKVLTFSAQDSPGIMLLIFNQSSGHVPLKILSIEEGTVLRSFNHLLHRHKKVEFIEQFNEKLLVKQENENLQILDLFLTFRNRTVAVWNFKGQLVTSFEDHLLWHPDCNTNNIYITRDQDLIISYCKSDSDDSSTDGNAGSINISNILTGKCLAKVKATKNLPINECNCSNNNVKLKVYGDDPPLLQVALRVGGGGGDGLGFNRTWSLAGIKRKKNNQWNAPARSLDSNLVVRSPDLNLVVRSPDLNSSL